MYSISLNLTLEPLTNIAITLTRFPYSRTIFQSTSPLTLISFAIHPNKLALAISFAIFTKFSFIVSLIANLYSLGDTSFTPCSFNYMLIGYINSVTISFALFHTSKIKIGLVYYNLKVWILN